MVNLIDGASFAQMIREAAYAVELRKKELNDLNVFPVPDGDTGINMSMTINAAVKEFDKNSPASMADASEVAAMAMLRGARGNSGVITSLLFRGFSKRMKGVDQADAQTFAAALREGVDAAYKAVMRPTEGTILTVSMKASNAAMEAAKATDNMRVTLSSALDAARRALAETTAQNPVLAKAGVIDAGAAGYVIILEAMLQWIRGESPEHEAIAGGSESDASALAAFDTEDIRFTYCTEFLIERSGGGNSVEFGAYLESIGDSVVVVEDDGLVKVHVHTNNPGLVLESALGLGYLDKIKIENMKLQHTQSLAEASSAISVPLPGRQSEPKPYGVVSVAMGGGLHSIFMDLGVDVLVDGGQTMNPSTEDLLKAAQSINTDVVYILPNNRNIIFAAQQVALLTEKKVCVVETKTVCEGISAMLAFNPEGEPEDNIAAMQAAAAAVQTGEVTYAARNSVYDERKIREGDYIALLGGKLVETDKKRAEVLKKLVREILKNSDVSYVTVIYGEGVTEDEAKEVGALFERERGDIEIAIIYGGQPVYYFIISAE